MYRQTLEDIPRSLGFDVRDRLLEFYAKHYSADQMTLCVAGKVRMHVYKAQQLQCGSRERHPWPVPT